MSVCHKCGMCCKSNFGAFIFPSDLISISSHLNISKENFLDRYCVLNTIPNDPCLVIYSLKMKDDKCVFLNELNCCDIYSYRPYQCLHAPFQFLSEYKFWKHMSCIKESDFIGKDSSKHDMHIFKELIDIGY